VCLTEYPHSSSARRDGSSLSPPLNIGTIERSTRALMLTTERTQPELRGPAADLLAEDYSSARAEAPHGELESQILVSNDISSQPSSCKVWHEPSIPHLQRGCSHTGR